MSLKDDELLNRIRESLDQSVKDLDGATRSHLASSRARALKSTESKRSYWLPAVGFATATVLVAALLLYNPVEKSLDEIPLAMLEEGQDLDIITALEDPELLEDLEFYYWLEEIRQDAT